MEKVYRIGRAELYVDGVLESAVYLTEPATIDRSTLNQLAKDLKMNGSRSTTTSYLNFSECTVTSGRAVLFKRPLTLPELQLFAKEMSKPYSRT